MTDVEKANGAFGCLGMVILLWAVLAAVSWGFAVVLAVYRLTH